MSRVAEQPIDVASLDPGNIAFAWGDSRVLFANGCSGYSVYDKVTLSEALDRFDTHAAWVAERRAAGNCSPYDYAPPEMRDLIIRAHGLAAEIAWASR